MKEFFSKTLDIDFFFIWEPYLKLSSSLGIYSESVKEATVLLNKVLNDFQSFRMYHHLF